ncbi:membrane protein [Clostridium botulinum A2B7 92]|uniref:DUF2975 domain-containing protein n=1 Tax=Clostridium botulinum TaxID=1491 RepID=A0A846J4I2_CLOBO|nr:DUF2975 domain-containing protein [Clostridium botulinum]ACA54690.1 putative membrane protein [Clostridium botulinum A3 str. Loch Maree]KEJ03432.1 membrane protein [Clostridium botulinum A2B7 92]NFH67078.1 DUF2975 domain-containing protein [Clostridium botulinum]NFJ06967.1 DUF2975 domain-containing protein [Clostridium botulinum]NFK13939.1 DUF2975 domain-containing protein [Clostridium botulinum]
MKETFSIKFIKLLLILTIFFCVVMLFHFSVAGIFAPEELYGNTSDILVSLIIILIYLIIAWNLLKIVYSIYSNPFTSKNIKSFKIIGYLMILLSIIDGIVNFKKKSNLEIIALGHGCLQGSCIFYLILGLLALVLAEIFKKAVQIKNENDLTI